MVKFSRVILAQFFYILLHATCTLFFGALNFDLSSALKHQVNQPSILSSLCHFVANDLFVSDARLHERFCSRYLCWCALHVCFLLKNIITSRHSVLLTNPEQRNNSIALAPMMIACDILSILLRFYLHSKGATRLTININVIFTGISADTQPVFVSNRS